MQAPEFYKEAPDAIAATLARVGQVDDELLAAYARWDELDSARVKPSGRQAVSPDMTHPVKNPGTAAVLSLLIPGVGQFYNGDFLRGLFWLIVTPGLWIGSGGLLGWICHVIASITAYRRARRTAAFA